MDYYKLYLKYRNRYKKRVQSGGYCDGDTVEPSPFTELRELFTDGEVENLDSIGPNVSRFPIERVDSIDRIQAKRGKESFLSYFKGDIASDHDMIVEYMDRKTFVTWNTLHNDSILENLVIRGRDAPSKRQYVVGGVNLTLQRLDKVFDQIKAQLDKKVDAIALQECELYIIDKIYQYIKDKPYIMTYCPSSCSTYRERGRDEVLNSSHGNCLIILNYSDGEEVHRDYFCYGNSKDKTKRKDSDSMRKILGRRDLRDIESFNYYGCKFCTIVQEGILYISTHISFKDFEYIKPDLIKLIMSNRVYQECTQIVFMGDINNSRNSPIRVKEKLENGDGIHKTTYSYKVKLIDYLTTFMNVPYKNKKLNATLRNGSSIVERHTDGHRRGKEKIDHILMFINGTGRDLVTDDTTYYLGTYGLPLRSKSSSVDRVSAGEVGFSISNPILDKFTLLTTMESTDNVVKYINAAYDVILEKERNHSTQLRNTEFLPYKAQVVNSLSDLEFYDDGNEFVKSIEKNEHGQKYLEIILDLMNPADFNSDLGTFVFELKYSFDKYGGTQSEEDMGHRGQKFSYFFAIILLAKYAIENRRVYKYPDDIPTIEASSTAAPPAAAPSRSHASGIPRSALPSVSRWTQGGQEDDYEVIGDDKQLITGFDKYLRRGYERPSVFNGTVVKNKRDGVWCDVKITSGDESGKYVSLFCKDIQAPRVGKSVRFIYKKTGSGNYIFELAR